jgi:anti-anti-sigma factor
MFDGEPTPRRVGPPSIVGTPGDAVRISEEPTSVAAPSDLLETPPMHTPHDPSPQATITVEAHDGVTVALLAGEHDLSTASWLLDVLTDQAGTKGVVVGLDGATFIDSHIIRSLYLAHSELERSGTQLVIQSRTHAIVARVLEITGLSTALPSAETLEDAIATLRHDRSSRL